MISGFVQTKLQREICNNRAGGKQFWGLVVSMLPDIIDHWQWRSLYLYVDENFGNILYGYYGAFILVFFYYNCLMEFQDC